MKISYNELYEAYLIASQERYKYKEVLDKVKEILTKYKSAEYGTYNKDNILMDLDFIFWEKVE